MNRIELYAGGALFHPTNPPTEQIAGIVFAADGNPHSCVWHVYAPTILRTVSSLILRFSFFDHGVAAGNARFGINWSRVSDTEILALGAASIIVPYTGVANLVPFVDLDIGSFITSDTTLFGLQLERDSSHVQDTLAGDATLINARTLES